MVEGMQGSLEGPNLDVDRSYVDRGPVSSRRLAGCVSPQRQQCRDDDGAILHCAIWPDGLPAAP